MSDELNELIVFVIRQTGWCLEYIRAIPFAQLQALAAELRYQKEIDDYRRTADFAMVIANWASAQGKRKFSMNDFMGEIPKRGGKENGRDEPE